MEFLNSKKFIIIMLIVLVWTGLSSCSSTTVADNNSHVIEKEWNDLDNEQAEDEKNPGPTDFSGIADALGCLFAPSDCPQAKSKEEQKLDR